MGRGPPELLGARAGAARGRGSRRVSTRGGLDLMGRAARAAARAAARRGETGDGGKPAAAVIAPPPSAPSTGHIIGDAIIPPPLAEEGGAKAPPAIPQNKTAIPTPPAPTQPNKRDPINHQPRVLVVEPRDPVRLALVEKLRASGAAAAGV